MPINNLPLKAETPTAIPVIVLGLGNIGQQFLKILNDFENSQSTLSVGAHQLVAVANSRYYQITTHSLSTDGINLSHQTTENHCNKKGQLYAALEPYVGRPAVLIDLTASAAVAEQYLRFAQNGWHIISANKLAAANHDWAHSIESALNINQAKWLKNTTVGASLPVQSSLEKIKQSGDQLHRVSGVFSGSLSWLFGQYDGQIDFMQWVEQAHQNAFTEPDPREDLSGLDVYRKALILAQQLGFKPTAVTFEPVLPNELLSGSLAQFWRNKAAINKYISKLWQQASQQGRVLRYLATVSAKELRVELVAVDSNHPAANIKPGDNIFIIESGWYSDNPLVIQGPGAGREVTAAGVLTDLIEVIQSS